MNEVIKLELNFQTFTFLEKALTWEMLNPAEVYFLRADSEVGESFLIQSPASLARQSLTTLQRTFFI